jgi:hypothetical protein
MDGRLQRRYVQLVEGHVNAAQAVAAGVHSLPGVGTTFAATQAAWRFLNNPRVSLPALVEPLWQLGRDEANASASGYALVVHDWSKLDYHRHRSKKDLRRLSQPLDVGYELASALLVDAATGDPLAPMAVAVAAAGGVQTTAADTPQPARPHLDQVLPVMRASRDWGVTKTLVHVIDREGDAVTHLRAWAADGHAFLVRADDRVVTHGGRRQKLRAVVAALAGALAAARPRRVVIRGRAAQQFVAEAAVVLTEPGWAYLEGGRAKRRVPGPPLAVRLVVARVRDAQGAVLAEWWLLTNVTGVPADRVAEWYYWRWRIESFHKLLKSAGLEVEAWGQETAPAIARRLLVGCMACVIVWRLRADDSPAARACRAFLVRLSGRQLKRGQTDTAPALLAGLHVFLAMLDALDEYTPDELRAFARTAVPHLRPPKDGDV